MYEVCVTGPMAADVGQVEVVFRQFDLMEEAGKLETTDRVDRDTCCYLVDLTPTWADRLEQYGGFSLQFGDYLINAEMP